MVSSRRDKLRIDDIVQDKARKDALNYECAVCLSLWNDPVQTGCHHIFCSSCVAEVQACPTCRQPFGDTKPAPLKDVNQFVLRALNNLEVRCPHANPDPASSWKASSSSSLVTTASASSSSSVSSKATTTSSTTICSTSGNNSPEGEDDGNRAGNSAAALRHQTEQPGEESCDIFCEWVGSYGDLLAKHLGQCGWCFVACPHGCGASLQRKQLEEHEKDCSALLKECDICGTKYKPDQEAEHHRAFAELHVQILKKEGARKDAELTRLSEQIGVTETSKIEWTIDVRKIYSEEHGGLAPDLDLYSPPVSTQGFGPWKFKIRGCISSAAGTSALAAATGASPTKWMSLFLCLAADSTTKYVEVKGMRVKVIAGSKHQNSSSTGQDVVLLETARSKAPYRFLAGGDGQGWKEFANFDMLKQHNFVTVIAEFVPCHEALPVHGTIKATSGPTVLSQLSNIATTSSKAAADAATINAAMKDHMVATASCFKAVGRGLTTEADKTEAKINEVKDETASGLKELDKRLSTVADDTAAKIEEVKGGMATATALKKLDAIVATTNTEQRDMLANTSWSAFFVACAFLVAFGVLLPLSFLLGFYSLQASIRTDLADVKMELAAVAEIAGAAPTGTGTAPDDDTTAAGPLDTKLATILKKELTSVEDRLGNTVKTEVEAVKSVLSADLARSVTSLKDDLLFVKDNTKGKGKEDAAKRPPVSSRVAWTVDVKEMYQKFSAKNPSSFSSNDFWLTQHGPWKLRIYPSGWTQENAGNETPPTHMEAFLFADPINKRTSLIAEAVITLLPGKAKDVVDAMEVGAGGDSAWPWATGGRSLRQVSTLPGRLFGEGTGWGGRIAPIQEVKETDFVTFLIELKNFIEVTKGVAP
ncbi:unnamed protein product [Amoebophrya sp. A120]|nr:unnamed protein product [Amoebophrya sp. A120]|eukprot:GSA120T00011941001.1